MSRERAIQKTNANVLNRQIKELKDAELLRTKEITDGYHSFDDLYYHRGVLFAVIVNSYSDKAWKTKLHSDGTMYDGMFIVGINTAEGQYSYHYNLSEWSLFECKELSHAPIWDGHMPDDIMRLMTLVSAEDRF